MDRQEQTTYRLKIEYDGSQFAGWQLQPNARTVQGCIEEALTPLFPDAPRVIGAGRTDTGVHATGMVAHFRTSGSRPAGEIRDALNGTLPTDVRILDAALAEADFHARFSARWRSYDYHISEEPSALDRHRLWLVNGPLDEQRLSQLAAEITGHHVFRSFAHERDGEEKYDSIIYRSEWNRIGSRLVYTIDGIRFLHGMVRLLVGTMVDIARGSLSCDSIAEILAAEDIRAAGTKAPARGLILTTVGYSDWPHP